MAENNLDKALAYLGSSLNSLVTQANGPVDLEHLHTKIAKRSLTGDHLKGGTIVNFASTGIKDEATSQQLTIKDSSVEIKNLTVESVKGNLTVENTVTAKTIKVDVLEVKEIKTDLKFGQGAPLEITVSGGETLAGKGLLLKGQGTAKQFIFNINPDKFVSTEHIELIKEKEYRIDGTSVLSSTTLGPGIVKSNLRELGRLRGLIVDGSASIGQYVFFDHNSNRLGVGLESPNAGLSVGEDGIEVMVGTINQSRGMVGTFASVPFDIVTDNTPRISISSAGNITLGNTTEGHIQVHVHGKLAVGVKTIDSRVDVHVAGAIKFNERIHEYLDAPPEAGTYATGSIVWNTRPEVGRCVGWVCVRAGTPGSWMPFGEIKQNG
jgi:hypothetical protein